MWIKLEERRNLWMTIEESDGDYLCRRKFSKLSGIDKK